MTRKKIIKNSIEKYVIQKGVIIAKEEKIDGGNK